MKFGKERFEYQLARIQKLTLAAQKAENPALYLYTNDLRTPLFMLEGLSRLYVNAHNKKIFNKLKDKSKQLEDGFGALDYYFYFKELFGKNKTLPLTIRKYFASNVDIELEKLNKILIKQDWLNGKRIKKINKKLDEVSWKSEETELDFFKEAYEKEISKIKEFVLEKDFNFVNMEEDVHELRRKLRWLSIYPHALKGLVKLNPASTVSRELLKYQTEEILNSPYNKIVSSRKYSQHLILNKNNFLALSWLISELGNIKDMGLTIEALKIAFESEENCTEAVALKKTYLALGKSQPKLETLLKNSSKISKQFFSEEVLDDLLKTNYVRQGLIS